MAAISSTYGHIGIHEVTRILNSIDQGEPHAADRLLPIGVCMLPLRLLSPDTFRANQYSDRSPLNAVELHQGLIWFVFVLMTTTSQGRSSHLTFRQ